MDEQHPPPKPPQLVRQGSARMTALPDTPDEKHFDFNPRSADERERARVLAETYARMVSK